MRSRSLLWVGVVVATPSSHFSTLKESRARSDLRLQTFFHQVEEMNGMEKTKVKTTETDFVSIVESGDKYNTLVALRSLLADRLQNTTSARDIASVSRRLMEVIDRIEEMDRQREYENTDKAKKWREFSKRMAIMSAGMVKNETAL